MVDLFLQKQNNQQTVWNSGYTTSPKAVETPQTPLIFATPKSNNQPEIKEVTIFGNTQTAEFFKEQEDAKKGDGLAKEIPGFFVLKDTKARQEQLGREFAKKAPDEQGKEFKRLVALGISKDDATILAGNLGNLNKKVQVTSANAMLDNKNLSRDVKTHSDNEVAKNVHTLDAENQTPIFKAVMDKTGKETKVIMATQCYELAEENQIPCTELVIATKDADVINAGASTSSRLSDKNQTQAVRLYQQTSLNAEQQKTVDKILINQYGQYAKENQVDIHTIMSASKYTETVQLAAANIYNFDKENQVAAFQVTMDTKNEAAINSASAQYSKYDDTAKNDIKTLVNNSEYNSAKTILSNSENGADSKTEKASNNVTSEETNTTKQSASQTFDEIKTAAKGNDSQKIAEKMKQLSPGDRAEAIRIVMANNPSLKVLAQISKMYKQDSDLIDKKSLLPQMKYFDDNTQSNLMTEFALSNDLKSINKDDLKSLKSKNKYDKLIKQEEQGKLGLG